MLCLKKFGSNNFVGPKKCWTPKNLGPKKIEKNFGHKKSFNLKKILGLKKCWVHKNIWSKRIYTQKELLVKKNVGPQNILDWKNILGQKKISGSKNFGPQKSKPWKNWVQKVRSKSVTAEILLIWTNAAWTYVVWTNVTVTVGLVSFCAKFPLYGYWLINLFRTLLDGWVGGWIKWEYNHLNSS